MNLVSLSQIKVNVVSGDIVVLENKKQALFHYLLAPSHPKVTQFCNGAAQYNGNLFVQSLQNATRQELVPVSLLAFHLFIVADIHKIKGFRNV